jgi:lipoprotein-releasing system permease protein
MTFSLFLALKYLKPKRSVTSVVTCVSVLGVILGVSIIIIVRAVMTGFGDLWREKILDFKPHITITGGSGSARLIENEE